MRVDRSRLCCGSCPGLLQQLRGGASDHPKTPLGYRVGYGYSSVATQAFNSKAYAESSTGRGRQLAPFVVRHHPVITDSKGIAELPRAIYGYRGQPAIEAALKLAPSCSWRTDVRTTYFSTAQEAGPIMLQR
jgi:hypothetical protein